MARDEDEKRAGIKVNDRRRIDAEGQERPEGEEGGAKPTVSPEGNPQFSVKGSEGTVEESGEGEPITFGAFVMSLATQALMQLGEMKPPPGVTLPIDRVGAQHTIDILALLEEKTKGNLDKEEDYMLREIVHNLRMAFVQTGKK